MVYLPIGKVPHEIKRLQDGGLAGAIQAYQNREKPEPM